MPYFLSVFCIYLVKSLNSLKDQIFTTVNSQVLLVSEHVTLNFKHGNMQTDKRKLSAVFKHHLSNLIFQPIFENNVTNTGKINYSSLLYATFVDFHTHKMQIYNKG